MCVPGTVCNVVRKGCGGDTRHTKQGSNAAAVVVPIKEAARQMTINRGRKQGEESTPPAHQRTKNDTKDSNLPRANKTHILGWWLTVDG
jgi:hypothetical protein